MSLIQLTRGQEETLSRIVTALEKIAENTKPKTANKEGKTDEHAEQN